MPKVKFNCTNCKKKLEKFKSQIPKSGKGYCSASCSTSYRNKFEFNPSHTRDVTGSKNPMFGKGYMIAGEKNGCFGLRGEKSPAWKGGRHKRKDGYFRVLVDGKRVLEHRKVLIDKGIDIDGMIVHHKNRNPSDNAIENLEIMDRREHITEHRKEMEANRKDIKR